MRFRNLRIAWSVGWGIAVALLIAMWVRSYSYRDQLYKDSATHRYGCVSDDGCINLLRHPLLPGAARKGWRRGVSYEDNPNVRQFYFSILFRGFSRHSNDITVPYWSPVLFCPTIATLSQWCKRFSLRTLLIATTLVAVVMGLIVWLG